jgi:tripartite-type tricarboxylate transporter receptor subunit TctC
MLGTTATHVFDGAEYPLKYDVVADFEPISLVAFDPQIILVRKDLPVANLGELIAWLKANPDKATAGTAGVGIAGLRLWAIGFITPLARHLRLSRE